MRYDKDTEVNFGDILSKEAVSDSGSHMFGYVTRRVLRGDAFGNAVYNLVLAARRETTPINYTNIPENVFMTTEECWSGYSEVTITSTWSSVVISVPEWNIELHYEQVSEFLLALVEQDDYR